MITAEFYQPLCTCVRVCARISERIIFVEPQIEIRSAFRECNGKEIIANEYLHWHLLIIFYIRPKKNDLWTVKNTTLISCLMRYDEHFGAVSHD